MQDLQYRPSAGRDGVQACVIGWTQGTTTLDEEHLKVQQRHIMFADAEDRFRTKRLRLNASQRPTRVDAENRLVQMQKADFERGDSASTRRSAKDHRCRKQPCTDAESRHRTRRQRLNAPQRPTSVEEKTDLEREDCDSRAPQRPTCIDAETTLGTRRRRLNASQRLTCNNRLPTTCDSKRRSGLREQLK